MRDLLGHASITTTERYDNQKLENLQAAAARLERGETFTPPPTAMVETEAQTADRKPRSKRRSRSNRQDFVKSWGDEHLETDVDRESETSTNSHADLDLEIWLGVRDDFRNWLVHAA